MFTPYSKCFTCVLFTSYLCFARFNLINQSVFFMKFVFFFSHVWSPYFLYLSLLFSCSRADSSSKKTKSSSEESRSETYGKLKQLLQPCTFAVCSLLSVCAPKACSVFNPLHDLHGWLCSREWVSVLLSACSFCSCWKLTRSWKAQAISWIFLLALGSWENLLELLLLEVLCH